MSIYNLYNVINLKDCRSDTMCPTSNHTVCSLLISHVRYLIRNKSRSRGAAELHRNNIAVLIFARGPRPANRSDRGEML